MNTILVCLDFSDVTPALLEVAQQQAKALDAEAVLLHVASVAVGVPMLESELAGYVANADLMRKSAADQLRRAREQLQQATERLTSRGVRARSLCVEGPVADTILAKADDLNPSLIVLGSHGHGALHHLLVGSVTEHLLRHGQRPVLVVPSPRLSRKQASPIPAESIVG